MTSVRGNTPSRLTSGRLCVESQDDRVAGLFLEQGPRGMAEKRQDNREQKVNARSIW
jgi:hypothetical protein